MMISQTTGMQKPVQDFVLSMNGEPYLPMPEVITRDPTGTLPLQPQGDRVISFNTESGRTIPASTEISGKRLVIWVTPEGISTSYENT